MKKENYKSVYIGTEGESLFTKQFDFWKYIEWNKDMPKYFQRLNKVEDERSFAILSASLLEYQFDKFLKEFIPEYKILVNKNTNFSTKINIVAAFNLIPKQFIIMSNLIRNIRNNFAHNLEVDNFLQLEDLKPCLINEMRQLWTKYEIDMNFWKSDKSLVFMYKDICRTAIEG